MNLQQIKTFLEEHDASSLQKLLTQQTRSVKEKIRKLEHSRTAINHMPDNAAKGWRKSSSLPTIYQAIRLISPQYIVRRRHFPTAPLCYMV